MNQLAAKNSELNLTMTSASDLKAAWNEVLLEKLQSDPSAYKHLTSAAFYQEAAMEFGNRVKDMTVKHLRVAMESTAKPENKRGLEMLPQVFGISGQKPSSVGKPDEETNVKLSSVVVVPSRKPQKRRNRSRLSSRSGTHTGNNPRRRYQPRVFHNRSMSAPRPHHSERKTLLLAGNNFGKFFNLNGLREPMVVLEIQKASELETTFVEQGHNLNDNFGAGILTLEKPTEMDDAETAFKFLKNRCEYVKIICERGANFDGLESKYVYNTAPNQDYAKMVHEIFKTTELRGLRITKNPLKALQEKTL
jgi:hypothetical protein